MMKHPKAETAKATEANRVEVATAPTHTHFDTHIVMAFSTNNQRENQKQLASKTV